MRKRTSVDWVATGLLAALGALEGCGEATSSPKAVGGGGQPTVENAVHDASAQDRSLIDGPEVPFQEASTDADASPALACTQHPCANPQPWNVYGVDTGFDICSNGTGSTWTRRRAIVECPNVLPRTPVCNVGDGSTSTCTADTDCTAMPYGHCDTSADGDGGLGCHCHYGCVRDSDCGSGSICSCGDPVGQCISASCSSGASCLPGCDCVSLPTTPFVCQTPNDQCIGNTDCEPGEVDGSPCIFQTLASGVCTLSDSGIPGQGLTCGTAITCTTGRPFVVRGIERFAARAARGDWAESSLTPEICLLPPSVRARVADHWTRTGLMEHASIAAFARFTMHLLAVGAPPDLVLDAQRAMGDETEHARLAFSLASAYAGSRVGPGELAIEGSLDAFTIGELVGTLIHEGCLGETLAAIEARDALDDARDHATRTVLERIASDELRHAELAWRTLRWLISSGRVSGDAARAALTDATNMLSRPSAPATGDGDLRAFGVVSEARRRELHRAAATHVIGPCAVALLESAALSSARGDGTARPELGEECCTSGPAAS